VGRRIRAINAFYNLVYPFLIKERSLTVPLLEPVIEIVTDALGGCDA